MSDKQSSNVAQLPDGWKMYDKYQIRHTDGTPLKGKKYFVLRLDSDNPAEAARVAAAMRAYKGELSDGNGAKTREALVNISKYADCATMRQHDATTQHYIEQIRKWAEAALAEPRRNCDVGTVEEQCVRYSRFCRQHAPCDNGNCPLRVAYDCKFTWGNMPYEPKEGGSRDEDR